MKSSGQGPSVEDEVDASLECALRETLSDVKDPRTLARVRQERVWGLALLGMSVVCLLLIALLNTRNSAVWALLLGSTALLLLFVGGRLVDRAARTEIQSHRDTFFGVLQDTLRDLDDGLMQAKIRRRRYFGITMLLLSGFCMGIVVTFSWALQKVDVLTWVGFSITLLVVGVWQLLIARRDERRAGQMLTDALRRDAVRTRTHIKSVKS